MAPKQVFKKVDIYLFWIIMCQSLIPLTLVVATTKVLGQRSIPDDKFLSLVSTLGSVFNMIGRLAWGTVADCLSYKVRAT